ncbi:GNAT family N-acetyltransferase [Actinoplanes sp. M2I2]|uniref:GNAT family N-acetyltransferase n=1 Tax=Actinoplanes sp. M2I2 TaxID=1734444 RepID=UPI0020202327|nr:GNAT family N-acetyltransferase [Actinoplanes sp. M2I2]
MTFDIGFATAETVLVTEVTELVNQAYRDGEKGLWKDGVGRTTPAEVRALAEAGELVVARSHGTVVGALRLHRLGPGQAGLGMLASRSRRKGAGVGTALVDHAEAWAAGENLTTMQLEILTPRNGRHPYKDFLMDWYERRGYRLVTTTGLDRFHPHLAPLLAVDCDVRVYRKALSPAGA